MSSFSPSDAALSGFRFIGRRPAVVLVWAGVFLAYQVLTTAILIAVAGEQFTAFTSMEAGQEAQAALAALPSALFILVVTLGGTLAIWSVMLAGAYRAQLRPSDSRFGFLRFGQDELRIAAVVVLCFAIALGLSFLIVFIASMFWEAGKALPAPLTAIYYLAVLAASAFAFVYPFVRLSLAMPMTIADHHIRLFESWRPTRGHFWSLLGAFVLSGILMFVMLVAVWSVVAIVAMAVVVGSGGSFTSLSGLFGQDASSLATYLTLPTLVGAALYALASAAMLSVMTGPVAEAYRFLVGDAPADPPKGAVHEPAPASLSAPSQPPEAADAAPPSSVH